MTQGNNLPAGQEYEYRESQPGEFAEPPSQQAINAQIVKSRMKRMLIPVILMLVVYVVYHILTWVSGHKSNVPVEEQPKGIKKELQVDSVNKPVLIAPQGASPDVAVKAQISRIEESMQGQLNNINQMINDNRDQTAKINDLAQQNQNDINSIKQSINSLNTVIVKIADDLEKLNKPKKVKKVVKRRVPIPVYHLVAIVPGRAWLQSSEGNTITIRTGDRLEGYGRIDVISPRQGIVATSSGTIIQYGVNDL